MRRRAHIKAILYLFTAIMINGGCEYETKWKINPSEQVIVVDALFTSELTQHEVRIYSSVEELNQDSPGVGGAEIKLIRDNEEWFFSESDSLPGIYISDSAFRISTGIEYALIVDADGTRDTALAEMVAISPLPSYGIGTYDSLYRFAYYNDDQPSMTNVHYNWSSNPDYCSSYGSCEALETFYSLNTIDVAETFSPAKQIIPFPLGTEIIRTKYSLSPEHQEFIRSLLIETEWRGGIFDVEQGNVPTNFNNGLHGWFGLCMVLSDTVDVSY